MRLEQSWICEECGYSGYVQYSERSGVSEVFHLIDDSHKEKSPACSNPVSELRCGTPCYLCKKSDQLTFLTVWPTYKKGELRMICRRHLLPGDIIVDAYTGDPIHMYGNQELWPNG